MIDKHNKSRSPHHTCSIPFTDSEKLLSYTEKYASMTARMKAMGNPLDYVPSTCWGNFGPLITNLVHDGDVAELFRALYLYLTIYDDGSPLASLNKLNFPMAKVTVCPIMKVEK